MQQEIAKHLDIKCLEISNVISTLERQIELLLEYKKSLVTETVTKGLNPDALMKDSGIEWIGEMEQLIGFKVEICIRHPK
jgi:type I restriction enzyme S subunit